MEETNVRSVCSEAEERYQNGKHKHGYNGVYQLYIKRIIDIVLCAMILPLVLLITIPIAFAVSMAK